MAANNNLIALLSVDWRTQRLSLIAGHGRASIHFLYHTQTCCSSIFVLSALLAHCCTAHVVNGQALAASTKRQNWCPSKWIAVTASMVQLDARAHTLYRASTWPFSLIECHSIDRYNAAHANLANLITHTDHSTAIFDRLLRLTRLRADTMPIRSGHSVHCGDR